MSALLAAGLLAAGTGVVAAQNPSQTTTTQMGQPQTKTTTNTISGTIVYVDGNMVDVKDSAGEYKEYAIPDGFKFQMGGKDLGVADLKPGMPVKATFTTAVTTTPVTVTDIRKGQVVAIEGETMIVRGPNGLRSFTQQQLDQRHIKLQNGQGQEISISALRPDDVVTAVIVTDQPPKVVSERDVKAVVQPAPTAAPR
jgi:hypothetical protein